MNNDLAWEWERGLQRVGLLYRQGVGCCVVMGGAVFYLTTRLGIGNVDFRRRGLLYSQGVGCCVVIGVGNL